MLNRNLSYVYTLRFLYKHVVSNLRTYSKMKKILKFILFLFVINNYGQKNILGYLNLKTELLKNKKELVIEYSQFCIGEIIMENKVIRVGITIGDINGVGLEVIIKALRESLVFDNTIPIIYTWCL